MHRLLGWMVICWVIGGVVQEVKPFIQGLMLLGAVLVPLLWKKEWSRWFKRKRRWTRKRFSVWTWYLLLVYALTASFLEIWQVFFSLGMLSCGVRVWWEKRKKGVALS